MVDQTWALRLVFGVGPPRWIPAVASVFLVVVTNLRQTYSMIQYQLPTVSRLLQLLPCSRLLGGDGLPFEPEAAFTSRNRHPFFALKHTKMRNHASVGDIGHCNDDINMADLEGFERLQVDNIKLEGRRFVFPDEVVHSGSLPKGTPSTPCRLA